MFLVSLRFAVAVSAIVVAGAAQAADKPLYGPPAKWVQVADIPASPRDDQAPSLQVLLNDNQSQHDGAGSTFYNRQVVKVLKSEALSGGARSVTWDPARQSVTLHGLAIVRDGKRIDLLKKGEDVLILRREKNLERAMLDGRLTASIQIRDLQVGDVVDWSYSYQHRDPLVGGRTHDFERMAWSGVAGRYRVRMLWDGATPVTWKRGVAFPEPKLSQSGRTHELLVDVDNAKAAKPPAGAPLRFSRLNDLEATTYRGWEDVSQTMAPLYVQAAVLKADSPLRAEIAAIAAESADPKVRAFKALQLVEDKTRYLLLGMGDGGYKPAPADETWARKFGDCKGKTVLLLAILRELGVEAEPALVAMYAGDGLDQRLASAAAFNHVIVRARIDGKSYWLDGTRTGDRAGLDALKPPPFRWALPLRTAGATLEEIVQSPLDAPSTEGRMRIDASAGLDKPAVITITTVLRGDGGLALARALQIAPRADVEQQMKQSVSSSNSWIRIETVGFDVSPAGVVTVTMTGEADLDWRLNDDVGVREFRVPGSGSGRMSGFPRREPGPDSDAPYGVGFPAYSANSVEVVLPNKGQGFSVKGSNWSGKLGGRELAEVSELRDGVARFTGSSRSVAREVPFEQAEEVNKTARRLSGEPKIIRAPKGL
ncbi:hypothetical protein E1H18_2694 [Caulobacter sp. RHG1]|nr:hypothetical protein [Caulobacter sp. RHG1]